jgi:type I restriction enzyme, S subunit
VKSVRANYPAYKESGVHWMGDIPDHWIASRIKEVLVERKEKNAPVKTEFILSLTAKKGVIPYSDKGGGGNKAKEDISQYNLAYPDDLIINCMNVVAGSVGLSKYYGAISPVYYALSKRSDSININFINHVFQLKSFQRSLIGLGNGILMRETEAGNLNTIRMRIPMSKLYRVLLPLPPKEEQDQIVRYLDSKSVKINKFIKNKKRLIELLKEQKQAVINQAVTKGLDPDAKMKPSGVEWLGDVPEGWEIRPLKILLKNITINTKCKAENELYIGLENVESWTGNIIDINREAVFESQAKKYSMGNILFGKLRPYLAKVTAPEIDGVCSGEFLVLKISSEENVNKFIEYRLRSVSYIELVNRSTYGAKMPRAEWGFIGGIKIALPVKEEQTKIVKHISKAIKIIDQTIDRINKEIDLITEYRTSLISAVVTGKVDVRNIEVDELPAEELSELELVDLADEQSEEDEILQSEVG